MHSCEEIAERLRRWHPCGRQITDVRVLSAGHSNATYYVDGLDQVLRMPPVGAGLLPPTTWRSSTACWIQLAG